VITQQPSNVICHVGDTASFTVVATDAVSYQWIRGATVPVGTDAATLEIQSVTDADFSSYLVIVSNADGSVQSEIASLSKEITDIDVPEKIIPAYVERPAIRVQLNGPMGAFPTAEVQENYLIRAKIDLGDGNFIDVPDSYRVTQPPQPGKKLVVYMVIKIAEE